MMVEKNLKEEKKSFPGPLCRGKNLTHIRMMTRIPGTKCFPEKSSTPRVNPEASATPNHPGASLPSEGILGSEPHSTIPRLQPLRGLYHFEVFPILKVSTPNMKLK